MRNSWIVLFILSLALFAEELSYSMYFFEDNQRNEVFTSSFKINKQILSRTELSVDVELDQVTVPPVDGVTGASRPLVRSNEAFKKNRGQLIMGLKQVLTDNTEVQLNYFTSHENDYSSQTFYGVWSQFFADKNFNLKIGTKYGWDDVGEILPDNSYQDDWKQTIGVNVGLMQLLSNKTFVNLLVDYNRLDGFLSDPYRQVSVFNGSDSTLVDERHPDLRERYSGSIKVKHYVDFLKGAIDLSFRYYMDTWGDEKEDGLTSMTYRAELSKYMTENFVVNLNLRLYSQSAVSFYKERYNGSEKYVTGDYKLQEFSSQNFGVAGTYYFRGLLKKNDPDLEFLRNLSLNLQYYRYVNDLDFSSDIFHGILSYQF